jgi:serine/threonine-protein kinase
MIGKTISHYKILEKLGEGGMGVVYKAEDTKLKRTVALKFLSPKTLVDPQDKDRFLHEAQASAALSHPSICHVYEIDEIEGQAFIAMEHLEGRSLKELIESGPLSLSDELNLAVRIAEGLQEAHEKGVVHRDVKPANIMVTPKGQAKIMDFGLAVSARKAAVTQEGTTLGTVAYMSPEQTRGEKVDRRSDIWSLGAVLYEMVTGRRPFKGDYEPAVVYSIQNESPEPPTALRTGVPMELERVIVKALAKAPRERYQHVEEMLVDLRSVVRRLGSGRDEPETSRPRARARRWIYAIAGVLVAASSAVVLRFAFTPEPVGTIDSIAVLPLQNISGDPDQEFFADGMTEALITELSKIGALKVISRQSVMRFKGSTEPLPEIAERLNVDAVVEGSALLAGDQVRITAQLIEASSDRHLWAESYDRDLSDVLSLQREVARGIAREIKIAVTPDEEARLARAHPVDPESHELCLKGSFYVNKWAREYVEQGIACFERALEKDPNNALAYAGLAEAYDIMVSFEYMPPLEGWPLAKRHALKALELDETLANAHTVLADILYTYEWEWDASEQSFKRALELSPNSAMAHHWYCYYLSAIGRHEEAIDHGRRALELDPLSVVIHRSLGSTMYIAGRYDEALEYAEEATRMDPTFVRGYTTVGFIYLKMGMCDEAIGTYGKAVDLGYDPWAESGLAAAYALCGQEAKARAMLDALLRRAEREYVAAATVARVYIGIGDNDRAFEWLEKALEERSGWIVWAKVHPIYDPLRSDPRFAELLKKAGLDS